MRLTETVLAAALSLSYQSDASTGGYVQADAHEEIAAKAGDQTRPSLVIKVGPRDFERLVMRVPRPVAVDFYAEWCGSCRRLAPAYERVAAQMGRSMTFTKYDIDSDRRTLSRRLGVRYIPTIIVFDRGQERCRVTWRNDEARLRRDLEACIAQRR